MLEGTGPRYSYESTTQEFLKPCQMTSIPHWQSRLDKNLNTLSGAHWASQQEALAPVFMDRVHRRGLELPGKQRKMPQQKNDVGQPLNEHVAVSHVAESLLESINTNSSQATVQHLHVGLNFWDNFAVFYTEV